MYPYRKPFPGRRERIVKYDTHIRPLFSTFSAPGVFLSWMFSWPEDKFSFHFLPSLAHKPPHYLTATRDSRDLGRGFPVSNSGCFSFFLLLFFFLYSFFFVFRSGLLYCRCGYCYKMYPLTSTPSPSRTFTSSTLTTFLTSGRRPTHKQTPSDGSRADRWGRIGSPGGWFHYLLSWCSLLWERIAPQITRCALELQDIFRKPNNHTHLHG